MEIEKETILLMSKGDKKAYETMFRRFYPKVHRFVAMLLKNEDDADDVSQLIFLKVWNKREKFADIQNFDSYLFILAKYTVINYISSKHIIPIDIDSLPDRYANESSPHDDVMAKGYPAAHRHGGRKHAATTPDDLSHEPRTASQERRDSPAPGYSEENGRKSS